MIVLIGGLGNGFILKKCQHWHTELITLRLNRLEQRTGRVTFTKPASIVAVQGCTHDRGNI